MDGETETPKTSKTQEFVTPTDGSKIMELKTEKKQATASQWPTVALFVFCAAIVIGGIVLLVVLVLLPETERKTTAPTTAPTAVPTTSPLSVASPRTSPLASTQVTGKRKPSPTRSIFLATDTEIPVSSLPFSQAKENWYLQQAATLSLDSASPSQAVGELKFESVDSDMLDTSDFAAVSNALSVTVSYFAADDMATDIGSGFLLLPDDFGGRQQLNLLGLAFTQRKLATEQTVDGKLKVDVNTEMVQMGDSGLVDADYCDLLDTVLDSLNVDLAQSATDYVSDVTPLATTSAPTQSQTPLATTSTPTQSQTPLATTSTPTQSQTRSIFFTTAAFSQAQEYWYLQQAATLRLHSSAPAEAAGELMFETVGNDLLDASDFAAVSNALSVTVSYFAADDMISNIGNDFVLLPDNANGRQQLNLLGLAFAQRKLAVEQTVGGKLQVDVILATVQLPFNGVDNSYCGMLQTVVDSVGVDLALNAAHCVSDVTPLATNSAPPMPAQTSVQLPWHLRAKDTVDIDYSAGYTVLPQSPDADCEICINNAADDAPNTQWLQMECSHNHEIHQECFEGSQRKHKCPVCNEPIIIAKGTLRYESTNDATFAPLPQFPTDDVLRIELMYPLRANEWPAVAVNHYWPDNEKGRELLRMLRRAFEGNALFDVVKDTNAVSGFPLVLEGSGLLAMDNFPKNDVVDMALLAAIENELKVWSTTVFQILEYMPPFTDLTQAEIDQLPNDTQCPVCLLKKDDITEWVKLSCKHGHIHCKDCAQQWWQISGSSANICPFDFERLAAAGGTLESRIEDWTLPNYPNDKTIVVDIRYEQAADWQPLEIRELWPDNDRGYDLLQLLKFAFINRVLMLPKPTATQPPPAFRMQLELQIEMGQTHTRAAQSQIDDIYLQRVEDDLLDLRDTLFN